MRTVFESQHTEPTGAYQDTSGLIANTWLNGQISAMLDEQFDNACHRLREALDHNETERATNETLYVGLYARTRYFLPDIPQSRERAFSPPPWLSFARAKLEHYIDRHPTADKLRQTVFFSPYTRRLQAFARVVAGRTESEYSAGDVMNTLSVALGEATMRPFVPGRLVAVLLEQGFGQVVECGAEGKDHDAGHGQ